MNENLVNIIACPSCKGSVKRAVDGDYLICYACKLKYPVIEKIPVMLVDEASPLTEDGDG